MTVGPTLAVAEWYDCWPYTPWPSGVTVGPTLPVAEWYDCWSYTPRGRMV